MSEPSEHDEAYRPDLRLREAYEEAVSRDRNFLSSVCPEYSELQEVAARYSDETLLGRGALKEVYRAYDHRTKRWVALARLHKDRGIEYYDDFVKEARLISALNHPNIIRVYDIGIEDDGRPFFTMDLKSGRSLEQVLKDKALTQRQLLRVFVQICEALAYAHARSIIHLDLKPENIQWDAYGEVFVCDWGIAQRLDQKPGQTGTTLEDRRSLESSTLPDPVRGTLGYMAPEQTIAGSQKDPRTDIFSLGCILYNILTGEAPFQGSEQQILEATRLGQPRPPRHSNPERRIPLSLEAIVMKALRRDPAKRYDSVERLRDDLQNYLGGFATRAEQAGFFRETRLFVRRNWLPTSILLAALILGSAGTVLFIANLREQQQAAQAERQRAERLLSTVDELYSDFGRLEEQTVASNEALARQLAEAARRLKNYGIFDQPVETIEQATDLTKIAINLDPESPEALWQLFSHFCLRLNYRAALALPPEWEVLKTENPGYHQLAEALPDYTFSKNNPPDAADLIRLIQVAATVEAEQAAHLERVLAYQFTAHPEIAGKQTVIEAFLRYLNPGLSDSIALEYVNGTASLHLRSKSGLILQVPPRGGSGRCLLHLMPIQRLSLEVNGEFDLRQIENLEIETLDLRGCRKIVLEEPLYLPRLRTLHVRADQFSLENLRGVLESDVEFEILATP